MARRKRGQGARERPAEPTPPADEDPTFCPNCSQPLTPLDAYCPACGTLLSRREEE